MLPSRKGGVVIGQMTTASNKRVPSPLPLSPPPRRFSQLGLRRLLWSCRWRYALAKIKKEPLQILTIPVSAACVGWITNKVRLTLGVVENSAHDLSICLP